MRKNQENEPSHVTARIDERERVPLVRAGHDAGHLGLTTKEGNTARTAHQ